MELNVLLDESSIFRCAASLSDAQQTSEGILQNRTSARALGVSFFLVLALAVSGWAMQRSPGRSAAHDRLTAPEFSHLIHDLSEEGGYFHSDNFISNETSYLHVVDKLHQLGASGGAYIGVGPEQNFTYIAKIHPLIAFIVDIRRQAMIQQLMYKAIFQVSPTRAEFLARLLSRPLPSRKLRRADAPLDELLNYFSRAPSSEKVYKRDLAEVTKTIQQTFDFPLSEEDRSSLEYVYKSFHASGLDISFQMDGYYGYFPSLKEILLGTDLHGNRGNFLAAQQDYQFVRDMQRRNLIIPVVGDFAGKKALAAVGEYLRGRGLTVTAFYTSNVEQYLFQNGVFSSFVANVRKLPINAQSLFIRAVPGRFAYLHPARQPGQRSVTLLESMRVFLQDFDAGRYESYYNLVTTHYIGP